MEVLIVWAVIWGVIGAILGERKGQPFGGFLISALLGPIGVLIVLLSKAETDAIEKRQRREGMRKCDHCAEMVKGDAIVCRYCGRDIVVSKVSSPGW
jgi:hypothetical protein